MAGPFCFLDRDGTIIADQGYLSDPDGVQLLAGAVDGLKRIAGLGYRLVIVTNQSGIGRGFFTAEAAQRTNSRLRDLLAAAGVNIAATMMCPHAPHENCACRKPGRGLVDRALALLGGTLEDAVVIGDKESDMALASAIGARGIRIGESASDLAAAAGLIAAWRAA